MIKLGDISILDKKLKPVMFSKHTFDSPQDDVTVAYHRDRNEKWKDTKPIKSKNIDEFNSILDNSWIEYIYIFDQAKNKWFWDEVDYKDNKIELKDLEDTIKKIDKVGIKSGNYFMLFDESEVPFLNKLIRTDIEIKFNDWNYILYEASNIEISNKIDSLMSSHNLGYDIDEYRVNKSISI